VIPQHSTSSHEFKEVWATNFSSCQQLPLQAFSLHGSVTVDAGQTGAHSYGAAQPTFWHTVFSHSFIIKCETYREQGSQALSEEAFFEAVVDANWDTWKLSKAIHTSGPFLSFKYFWRHRQFLMKLYEPNPEVQRWVNDVATELKLVHTGQARHYLQPLGKGKTQRGTRMVSAAHECDPPPSPCKLPVERLRCSPVSCADNVALHIRLEDKSSAWDYWDAHEMKRAANFTCSAIQNGKRVVVFSNDRERARALLLSADDCIGGLVDRLDFSRNMNVIEFYLMSQYFGTHILTGSTYQQWALFLSPIQPRALLFDSIIEDLGLFTAPNGSSHIQIMNFPDDVESYFVSEAMQTSSISN
jgi:hypothetical protein